MAEIKTNRDLYCFVTALVKRQADGSVTLQAYLENLGQLGRQWCERSAILPSEFAQLLEALFAPTPTGIESTRNPTGGYLIWEQRIAEQVRDLSEMKAAGTLENQYRYFGVAPRAARTGSISTRARTSSVPRQVRSVVGERVTTPGARTFPAKLRSSMRPAR